MCTLCSPNSGFSLSHPAARIVAVETQTAIDAGLLQEAHVAVGSLSAARQRLSAIDTLNQLQARLTAAHPLEELAALPQFFVLLLETDTLGYFHPSVDGFDSSVVPETPDFSSSDNSRRYNVVVTSEIALRSWFRGQLEIESLFENSLVLVDGPSAPASRIVNALKTSA